MNDLYKHNPVATPVCSLKATVVSVCCWIPPGYHCCCGTVENLVKDVRDIMYLDARAACVHWVTTQKVEQSSGPGGQWQHFVPNKLLLPQ